eukprot:TRINITY_DN10545_c0_g1_i3.p1 TRINITY_DN10545_c0_g1~~TRINITY_DN10545_c0_g1_i3.p1  ORF type:complete len:125 (+),score=28.57 TRINITY_DN10545_c0_g1_i3:155-529(+)
MLPREAKILLGFASDSFPSSYEVKAAYKKMAWETHPDRFPENEKAIAEEKFKLVSEAYGCLKTGVKYKADTAWTSRSFSRKHSMLVMLPFALIVFGTLSFGGYRATKEYRKQRRAFASQNPFLP